MTCGGACGWDAHLFSFGTHTLLPLFLFTVWWMARRGRCNASTLATSDGWRSTLLTPRSTSYCSSCRTRLCSGTAPGFRCAPGALASTSARPSCVARRCHLALLDESSGYRYPSVIVPDPQLARVGSRLWAKSQQNSSSRIHNINSRILYRSWLPSLWFTWLMLRILGSGKQPRWPDGLRHRIGGGQEWIERLACWGASTCV